MTAACSACSAAAVYDDGDDSVWTGGRRCFSVGAIAISEERNEMRGEPGQVGSAAGAAGEGATSCWTIYIADPHRPQRWRAQMMAMMTAIVRSGEAAASDRGREQDSNRGKCLTSPAPRSLIPYDTSHRETEDDRDRAVDVEGQLQLPQAHGAKGVRREERPTNGSIA